MDERPDEPTRDDPGPPPPSEGSPGEPPAVRAGPDTPAQPVPVDVRADGALPVPPQPDAVGSLSGPPTVGWEVGPGPAPKRSRAPLLIVVGVLLVVVVIGVVAFLAGREDEGPVTATDGRFQGHGLSFDFPSEWLHRSGRDVLETAEPPEGAPVPGWQETFFATDVAFVLVAQLDVGVPITAADLEEGEFRDGLLQGLERSGVTMVEEPTVRTVAGHPAFDYVVATSSGPAGPVEVRQVYVFRDTSAVLFSCQYTDETRAEILAGCDQILETLEFD